MYKIVIENIYSYITPALDEKIIRALRNKLSFEIPGAFYARQRNPFAGTRYFFTPKTQQFPTGMIAHVRGVLDANKVQYEYSDLRQKPVLGPEIALELPKGVKFYPHQVEAVEKALAAQRGIVKSSTGSGKSLMIASVIGRLNIPTILFIHKTDVFYQLISTLERTLKIPIGVIGNGQCEIERINVAMIQTVARAFDPTIKKDEEDDELLKAKGDLIRKLVMDAQCIVSDETHHLASDSFWTVYKNAPNAFYRYGFSASPWRDDNATLLIEGGTAKQVVDIPASILIDKGYLTPVDIYLYDVEHKPQPKGIRYPALYDQEIVLNAKRNELIVDLALKASKAGKSVLIAVTKIEHGEILEALLRRQDPTAIFCNGQSDTELRRKVLDGLSNHTQRVAICTTIFGEGVDAPGLDVLINAKAGASSVDAFQLVGRVLRLAPGKKKAYVIDLADQGCRFLGPHSNERLKIYHTERNYSLKFVSKLEEVKFND